MAYCGPRGIPLSGFLAWSDEDQQAAIAWQLRENQRCGGCGTHADEWESDRNAFHTEIHECVGCKLIEQARGADAYKETKGAKVMLLAGSAAVCPSCQPRR